MEECVNGIKTLLDAGGAEKLVATLNLMDRAQLAKMPLEAWKPILTPIIIDKDDMKVNIAAGIMYGHFLSSRTAEGGATSSGMQ
eukprot:3485818-Amphidinium_carterae.1